MLERKLAPHAARVEHYVLGELEHGLDIECVELAVVALDSGDCDLGPQSVELALVGLLVNRLFVDERFHQPLLLLLEGGKLLLQDRLDLFEVPLPLAPDLQDRLAESFQVFRLGLQVVQELEESLLESFLAGTDATALRAVVIGVALSGLAAGPASGQWVLADAATDKPSQRKVRVMASMALSGGFRMTEDRLDAEERVLIDNGLEVTHHVDAPGIVADLSGVERVFEHVAEALEPYLAASLGAKPGSAELVEDFSLGVKAGGVELEGTSNQRCPFRVGFNSLGAVGQARIQVAKRCWEGPAAALESLLHSEAGLLGTQIVVELGDRRQDAFHELPRRTLVDRLGDGSEGHTQSGQEGPDHEVIVIAAGQAIEGIDHDHLEPASILPTVIHQPLELGAVSGLG